MSVLHVLRAATGARAEDVLRAQAEQGVDLRVLLLEGAPVPALDAPLFAVGDAAPAGAQAVGWPEALAMVFAADTVVTW